MIVHQKNNASTNPSLFKNEARAAAFMIERMSNLILTGGFHHSDGHDFEKSGAEVLLERPNFDDDTVTQVRIELVKKSEDEWLVDEMSRVVSQDEAVNKEMFDVSA